MDTYIIREVQEYLRILSFYDPRLPPIAVDGVYSHQTREAVRIFQTLYSLNPSGEVDTDTWEQLRDTANEQHLTSPSALHAFPHPDYILYPNETNVTAGLIQQMLNELSTYYINIQTVNTSGTYDAASVTEIQNIQKLHQLEANGNVDLATWNVLATLFNNRFDSARR